jgi:aminopeptidase N
MRYYDKYFGIKYPYGKLDLVGLADFSAGAMENTGCITFREVLLLVDEKNSSLELRKYIASVISHEMAHQWFGDLVTMQWWDDLWLNEGFASWMSSKPVAAWKPEWNVQLDDVRDATQAMAADSLANTHPIHQEAKTPGEILELADEITYSKTAAVLRMIEAYLGPDTFRAGVNAYLKQHAYGNATAADFWRAQARTSRKPVDQIMPTWVNQPGVPMVSVAAQCSGLSEITTLKQNRYFADRAKFEAGSPELWQIPVCLKHSGASGGNAACQLLTQKQEDFPAKSCSPWVYANADAKGYYQSSYSPENLHALAKVEETGLTPAERILLLSDASSSVAVDRASIGDYLALAEGLQREHTPAVLTQLVNQLDWIGKTLVSDTDRPAYEQWVRQLLDPIAKQVGWEAKAGESDDTRGLRAHLLFALGFIARDPDAVAFARKLAQQALADPKSVDHDVAAVALEVSARNGDEAFYNEVLEHLKNAKSPEAVYVYRQTLTDFTDPKLVQRTLDYALSPEVRSQDAPFLFGRMVRNPEESRMAWDFARAHWGEISKMGGAFASGAIVESAGAFCDSQLESEVKDFFAAHPVPSAERTLRQSLESIGQCIDMKTRQAPQLATWLGRQSSVAGQ